MTEIKKPYELKEGDFCYIKEQVCQIHKIRTACGEYYMAGYPISGEKEELDEIVDCTETVKVPEVAVLKVSNVSPTIVTVQSDPPGDIPLPEAPLSDHILALHQASTSFSVKVVVLNGEKTIVDIVESE